jgi:hypothetical protein
MAVQNALLLNGVAGTTFSSGDLYKGVTFNASGHVVLAAATDTAATIIGTLNQFTGTTSAAGVEAVTYQWGPEVQVRMAASTAAAGDLIAFSTAGLGIVPTTDSDAPGWGVVKSGSSGAVNRIYTVVRTGG